MQFDVHFAIDQFTTISVVVPDLSKNTKQYKHIEEWNRFDTAYFRAETNTTCLDIKRDSILTSLIEFYNVIDIALTYTTSMAHHVSPGTIGKELSKAFYNLSADETFIHNTLVWSHCIPIATLLYRYRNSIFIEVAPTYPWSLRSIKQKEYPIYYPYEIFLKNYQPHIFAELSQEQCISWQNMICTILWKLGATI